MNRIAIALAFAIPFIVAMPARPACATPLELGHIPADALGVGHVDIEALRKTTFFGLLGLDKPDAVVTGDLAPIAERAVASCVSVSVWLGDKRKDDSRDGAVLVEFPHGSKLAGELVDATVKRLHGTKNGDWYEIQANKETFRIMAIGDVLVLADDPGSMRRTIAVMQGKAKTLTEKALPGGAIGHGLLVFAALGTPLLKDVKQAAGSTLLKTDMTSLVIDVAQIGTDLRARAIAMTNNADEAKKVKTVLDGLIALISLADEAKPFQPIERYLKTSVDGTKVSITLTVPVIELLAALAKKH